MKYKACLAILLFFISIAAQSQSQRPVFRKNILPKIKSKIYSLYPNASNLGPDYPNLITDSTQEIQFNCNCNEGLGRIYMLFDTNGSVLNKNIYISLSDLPVSILYFFHTDFSRDFRYDYNIIKSINDKGSVSYKVSVYSTIGAGRPIAWGWYYILKFDGSGRYISAEKKRWNF